VLSWKLRQWILPCFHRGHRCLRAVVTSMVLPMRYPLKPLRARHSKATVRQHRTNPRGNMLQHLLQRAPANGRRLLQRQCRMLATCMRWDLRVLMLMQPRRNPEM
jgi:hypothetical protein